MGELEIRIEMRVTQTLRIRLGEKTTAFYLRWSEKHKRFDTINIYRNNRFEKEIVRKLKIVNLTLTPDKYIKVLFRSRNIDYTIYIDEVKGEVIEINRCTRV